jgi:hypothetical protein
MATKVLDINKLIGNSYFILKKLIGAGLQIPGEFADNLPVRELPYQEEEEEEGTGQRQETQYTAPVGNIILEDEKTLETIARYESTEAQTIYNTASLVKPTFDNIINEPNNEEREDNEPLGLDELNEILNHIIEQMNNYGIYNKEYLDELETQIDNFETKNDNDKKFIDDLKTEIDRIRTYIEIEETNIKIMKSNNNAEKEKLNEKVKENVIKLIDQKNEEVSKILENNDVKEDTKNEILSVFKFSSNVEISEETMNKLSSEEKTEIENSINEIKNIKQQVDNAETLTSLPSKDTNEEKDIKTFYNTLGLTDEELGITNESPNITNNNLISMYNHKKIGSMNKFKDKWTIDELIKSINVDDKKILANTARSQLGLENPKTSTQTKINQLLKNTGVVRQNTNIRQINVKPTKENEDNVDNKEGNSNTNSYNVKRLDKIPVKENTQQNTAPERESHVESYFFGTDNDTTGKDTPSKGRFNRPREVPVSRVAWGINTDKSNEEVVTQTKAKAKAKTQKQKPLNLTNPIQSSVTNPIQSNVIKRPTFEELKKNTILNNYPDTTDFEKIYKKILEKYQDKIPPIPLKVENTKKIAEDLKITENIDIEKLRILLQNYENYIEDKKPPYTTSTFFNNRKSLEKNPKMFVEDSFEDD